MESKKNIKEEAYGLRLTKFAFYSMLNTVELNQLINTEEKEKSESVRGFGKERKL